MQIGTVIICRIHGSFSNYVGVVVGNTDGMRVTLNDRTVAIRSEHILSVVGITNESIELAQDNGRWMQP